MHATKRIEPTNPLARECADCLPSKAKRNRTLKRSYWFGVGVWKDGAEIEASVAGQTDKKHLHSNTTLVDEIEAGQQFKRLKHRVTHNVIREESLVIWCYEDDPGI